MSFKNLDLNLLRVFDAVMAERNLSRAAAQLALTQPAISNAIARLRTALDDPLLTRVAGGVKPTPYAERIWPAVREALSGLQASLLPDGFDPKSARQTFRIAMADATAALLIPPLVATIELTAPGVSLRVLPLTTRDPRSLLEQDTMDLAVGYFPLAINDVGSQDAPRQIDHLRLYDGEYVVAMRADHELAQGELTLDSFCSAQHLLVSFSGRAWGFVDETLAGFGRRRRVLITVNQFFTAGRVVTQSDLLTVLPRHFIEATGYADQIAIRPMPFRMDPVHVDMVWHQRNKRLASHQWLRKIVEQAAISQLPTERLLTKDSGLNERLS